MISKAQREGHSRYRKTPKGRYLLHKQRAKRRWVPFKLTFQEWWSYWAPHWGERNGQGNLHMCRNGDKGAYEVGNVRIGTLQENRAEPRFERCAITGRFLR